MPSFKFHAISGQLQHNRFIRTYKIFKQVLLKNCLKMPSLKRSKFLRHCSKDFVYLNGLLQRSAAKEKTKISHNFWGKFMITPKKITKYLNRHLIMIILLLNLHTLKKDDPLRFCDTLLCTAKISKIQWLHVKQELQNLHTTARLQCF